MKGTRCREKCLDALRSKDVSQISTCMVERKRKSERRHWRKTIDDIARHTPQGVARKTTKCRIMKIVKNTFNDMVTSRPLLLSLLSKDTKDEARDQGSRRGKEERNN